ncbi:hypothetical protein ACJJ2P_001835 [Escherichia coli]
MKPDVKKIIADIKATKGNRKFCNGLAGTLQDDNYASSICKYVKTVTPERIDLLIEYAEKLEAEVTDMAVQLANAESKCRELAVECKTLSRFISGSCYVFDGDHDDDMPDEFIDASHYMPIATPATDAFLAEVRASARNEGINYAASRLAAAYNHGFIDKPLAEVKTFPACCRAVLMILSTTSIT